MPRGRPRKKAITSPSVEAVSQSTELTQQEVWDVLQFAATAYSTYGLPGTMTPTLVSTRLREISMHPAQATLDKINAALLDPVNKEAELQGYSEFLELNSMMYRRLLRYISDMAAWNISYTCTNMKDEEDYDSPAYKRDLALVANFFDRFDHKSEFRIALREMVRRESFFAYFRNEGAKYVLQELPRDRCLITGRWDYGMTFDFDMLYFIQPGVSIDMYPDIFKEWYAEVLEARKSGDVYDPAAPIDRRNSQWVYWKQTSPDEGFWAWKFSPEIISQVPFFAPLFPDIVTQPIIRDLQKNSYMQMAAKMIMSSVPLLDKGVKGAAVSDNIAVTPETMGKFLNLVRQGITSAVNVGALPSQNITALEFTGDKDIYNSWSSTTASLSGLNSRLLFTKDRQNVLETQYSMDIDKFLIEPVFGGFANFLDFEVNKLTKKYKFHFKLWGTQFADERKAILDESTSLASIGIVLPQQFAAGLSMTPFEFERQLAEARAGKWTKKLTPIVSAFQQPKGAGRPSKEAGELSDSGQDTRSAGSNIEKGGSE